MIQGAIIGAVVGVVFYFVQKSMEKKAKQRDMLDEDVLNDDDK